jgi:hypothetical protein
LIAFLTGLQQVKNHDDFAKNSSLTPTYGLDKTIDMFGPKIALGKKLLASAKKMRIFFYPSTSSKKWNPFSKWIYFHCRAHTGLRL